MFLVDMANNVLIIVTVIEDHPAVCTGSGKMKEEIE